MKWLLTVKQLLTRNGLSTLLVFLLYNSSYSMDLAQTTVPSAASAANSTAISSPTSAANSAIENSTATNATLTNSTTNTTLSNEETIDTMVDNYIKDELKKEACSGRERALVAMALHLNTCSLHENADLKSNILNFLSLSELLHAQNTAASSQSSKLVLPIDENQDIALYHWVCVNRNEITKHNKPEMLALFKTYYEKCFRIYNKGKTCYFTVAPELYVAFPYLNSAGTFRRGIEETELELFHESDHNTLYVLRNVLYAYYHFHHLPTKVDDAYGCPEVALVNGSSAAAARVKNARIQTKIADLIMYYAQSRQLYIEELIEIASLWHLDFLSNALFDCVAKNDDIAVLNTVCDVVQLTELERLSNTKAHSLLDLFLLRKSDYVQQLRLLLEPDCENLDGRRLLISDIKRELDTSDYSEVMMTLLYSCSPEHLTFLVKLLQKSFPQHRAHTHRSTLFSEATKRGLLRVIYLAEALHLQDIAKTDPLAALELLSEIYECVLRYTPAGPAGELKAAYITDAALLAAYITDAALLAAFHKDRETMIELCDKACSSKITIAADTAQHYCTIPRDNRYLLERNYDQLTLRIFKLLFSLRLPSFKKLSTLYPELILRYITLFPVAIEDLLSIAQNIGCTLLSEDITECIRSQCNFERTLRQISHLSDEQWEREKTMHYKYLTLFVQDYIPSSLTYEPAIRELLDNPLVKARISPLLAQMYHYTLRSQMVQEITVDNNASNFNLYKKACFLNYDEIASYTTEGHLNIVNLKTGEKTQFIDMYGRALLHCQVIGIFSLSNTLLLIQTSLCTASNTFIVELEKNCLKVLHKIDVQGQIRFLQMLNDHTLIISDTTEGLRIIDLQNKRITAINAKIYKLLASISPQYVVTGIVDDASSRANTLHKLMLCKRPVLENELLFKSGIEIVSSSNFTGCVLSGDSLFTSESNGSLTKCNAANGAIEQSVQLPVTKTFNEILIPLSAKLLLVYRPHHDTLILWDLKTNSYQTLVVETAAIHCINASPDGTRFRAVLYDGKVIEWQIGELRSVAESIYQSESALSESRSAAYPASVF